MSATTTQPLRIVYFAWLRERVGVAEESLQPPPGIGDVAALRDWLASRSPRHAHAFARADLIRCSVNQQVAGPGDKISAGDEIAFFPPVTGG